jgi:hypothetical protein
MNQLVIPDARNDARIFWEKLRSPAIVKDGITLLVEAPATGFIHAVTVDDALRVFAMLPAEHAVEVDAEGPHSNGRRETRAGRITTRAASLPGRI